MNTRRIALAIYSLREGPDSGQAHAGGQGHWQLGYFLFSLRLIVAFPTRLISVDSRGHCGYWGLCSSATIP